jgi:hypothetical protein
MLFEQGKTIEKWGERAGFLIAYILFTTILLLIISLSHEIKTTLILVVAGITIAIVMVGSLIKRMLR